MAQEITLIRPTIVRRVVLASAAPQGAADMHGWAPAVLGAAGKPQVSPEEYIEVFFAPSPSSRIPDHGSLQRTAAIGQPVFIASGDSDPMIPPRCSYLLAGLIPQAQAAHGGLPPKPDSEPSRLSGPLGAVVQSTCGYLAGALAGEHDP